ncbi:uncharacterized protein CMC5_042180 [Chondromyces crocatus]|uniref:LamG-like jellyroll fold domain-containing protein n=2 Tax=Chondromyces crocatus TaxID=52 RepID=A0A0K1EGT5_CHOCO|nr:uncharacterized protein CMC5_042180 [Chondromyces crocatus]
MHRSGRSAPWLLGAAVGGLIVSTLACSAITGLDDFSIVGDTPVDRPEGVCAPSQSTPCYTGPAGTEDLGACKAGTMTCTPLGTWGPCTGEVTPVSETLGGALDADCGGTALTDTELLVRYLINEAPSGRDPTELRDAAPSPLRASITYGTNLAFLQDGLGRVGLSWSAFDRAGYAVAQPFFTKVARGLDQAQALTLELVTDLRDSGDASGLVVLGDYVDAKSRLAIVLSDDARTMDLLLNDQPAMRWGSSAFVANRAVLHLVMDTTLDTESDRWKLYRNGQLVPGVAANPPPEQGTKLDAGTVTSTLVLGNRYPGNASFQGTIFYAAIYGRPLTDSELQHNAAVLIEDDDSHVRPGSDGVGGGGGEGGGGGSGGEGGNGGGGSGGGS